MVKLGSCARRSFVPFVALLLETGCTEAPAEDFEGGGQHLETPAERGSYVEIVDTTPDRPSNQPHGFAYRPKDDNGEPTTLRPGESIVLKVSAKTLAAMRWNEPKPIKRLSLSIDYWRGDYENEKHDARTGDSSTEDFVAKGWASSAFTIPREVDHVQFWLAADGYPLPAPRAVLELGETLPLSDAEE